MGLGTLGLWNTSSLSLLSWTKQHYGRYPSFILSKRSDFRIVINLAIALISLEILLPREVNWSTKFSGVSLNMKMALYSFKAYENVFAFTLGLMTPAIYSRLFSMDLIWADVFVISACTLSTSVTEEYRHLLVFYVKAFSLFSSIEVRNT